MHIEIKANLFNDLIFWSCYLVDEEMEMAPWMLKSFREEADAYEYAQKLIAMTEIRRLSDVKLGF